MFRLVMLNLEAGSRMDLIGYVDNLLLLVYRILAREIITFLVLVFLYINMLQVYPYNFSKASILREILKNRSLVARKNVACTCNEFYEDFVILHICFKIKIKKRYCSSYKNCDFMIFEHK